MNKIILCLLTLVSLYSNAQPSIAWQKCYGGKKDDKLSSIQQTTDGGYILIGTTTSNDFDVSGNHGMSPFGDIWVVKLTNLGIIEWQKCFGGSDYEEGKHIQQTNDGGYILTGYTNSNDGDVSQNRELVGADAWVIKLSSLGDIEWQKYFEEKGNTYGSCIRQSSDGGYILIGNKNEDIWVVKLTNKGVIKWQKSFGGIREDRGNSIEETSDGGYIIIGTTNSFDGDVSSNHGSVDIWVVKLTNLGIIKWQKCLGGKGLDDGASIKQTSDGGYILIGAADNYGGDVSGNHGDRDAWVVKLSSIGNIEWQKCLGGKLDDAGNSIQQTVDGGYILSGRTSTNDGDFCNQGGWDGWVIKLSSLGVVEWQKCLGSEDYDNVKSIQKTTDGGYILGGITSGFDNNHGQHDFWVVKLSN